jgi:hypothetical protein
MCETFFGAEGTGESKVGGGCWGRRRTTGNRCRGRTLAARRLACCGQTDPRGASRHQQRGGLSHREERRGPAAAILMNSRRQKTMCGGFCYYVRTPAAFLDPAMVTVPYPTATHYRHAHLILERASPGRRRGPHSNQDCSTDARSVGGGYGRWLIFQTCTRVPYRKKPGKWPGKLFSAAA